MKKFAALIKALESTNKTNARIDALITYFSTAADKDILWLITLFTGKRPKRPVNTKLMREWAREIVQIPEWLFIESYAAVGDLSETIALILPPALSVSDLTLTDWMHSITTLYDKTEAEKKYFVVNAWQSLDITERIIFNKLLGGSFRIGVSDKILVNALAKYADAEPAKIMHSIMGKWSVHDISFRDLLSGVHINADASKPYPFCLAYALEKELQELGDPEEWFVEYKWDGIRGQVICRNGEIFVWSRGEELVTAQFPEIVETCSRITTSCVIDGEIVAIKDGAVLNFNELQKRLNRKIITKKMLADIPVGFIAYDILEYQGEDIRTSTMQNRRSILEQALQPGFSDKFRLSQLIHYANWDELDNIRSNARMINSEGLMLKNKSSLYHSGRKKGDWWKWKINPLTIDAVLIYAQKGSGRRSGHYTDYTFAVKNGDELVTIAKAYSGLTEKEIAEVSRFVTKNSIEKFGPVRTVIPALVFELAFEGIGFSNRHKSGVALRFPRISRWRKDKTVNDIDDIENVKKLIR